MGAVYFYHLTRQSLQDTLPVLLEKARGAGWRILVRGQTRERMAWLDERLWLGSDSGFLPHGLCGGAHDAMQPILLSEVAPIDANIDCVMAVDGARLDAKDVETVSRACVLFDGTDPEAVDQARNQWRDLTTAGCMAQYWSEESGRWEKKAESGG